MWCGLRHSTTRYYVTVEIGLVNLTVSGVLKNNAHCVTNVCVSETLFQSLSEEDTDFAHSCTSHTLHGEISLATFCRVLTREQSPITSYNKGRYNLIESHSPVAGECSPC